LQSLLRLKRQKDGAARFAVTHIPAVAGHVPPYKAWAFLLNNERAVQTGRQMFYIDASGEVSRLTAGVPRFDCSRGTGPQSALGSCNDVPRSAVPYCTLSPVPRACSSASLHENS